MRGATRNSESLIYATASYDTHTFPAILDSGSEVNLICEDVWKQLPGVSVDKSQVIVLIDVSEGKTEITGCIEDLTLTIHGVPTTANYWVSKNSPPDILLGRDWQRRNCTFIIEKQDGTYLRFSEISGIPGKEIESLTMPPPVRRKRMPHNSACSHFIGMIFAKSANGPQSTLGSDTELLSLVSLTFQEVDTVDSKPR